MAIILKLVSKLFTRGLLIFIFIFQLYILEFTNFNLITFDLVDYLCILGIFNDANNTSKKKLIREAVVSIKIRQFHELVYNLIIHLSVLI